MKQKIDRKFVVVSLLLSICLIGIAFAQVSLPYTEGEVISQAQYNQINFINQIKGVSFIENRGNVKARCENKVTCFVQVQYYFFEKEYEETNWMMANETGMFPEVVRFPTGNYVYTKKVKTISVPYVVYENKGMNTLRGSFTLKKRALQNSLIRTLRLRQTNQVQEINLGELNKR